MRGREFITLLAGTTAAWPLAASAEQGERIRRLGVLMGYAESDPGVQSFFAAFRSALAKLGWTDGRIYMPSIRAAATSLAVEVSAAPVNTKDEIEGVIPAQAGDPGGSLIVMLDKFNRRNGDVIVGLAARYKVPAIYYNRSFVESGGLIAYSDDFAEEFRQAAGYIDRILRGSKVAALPIQQPTKFELLINMKTAKALGLTLSSGLFSIADEVIE
jgi:putative ABC transport system substrate-binding protein